MFFCYQMRGQNNFFVGLECVGGGGSKNKGPNFLSFGGRLNFNQIRGLILYLLEGKTGVFYQKKAQFSFVYIFRGWNMGFSLNKEALHAGQSYLGPELSPLLLQRDLQHEAEGLAALSAREFEVFRLLAQGHSSAQCAQAMNLSPKTIANHQSLIKEKLGVATSAALAHLAIRHRVIDAVGV